MGKTSQLHEILAVLADTQNAAAAIQKETIGTFGKKSAHFAGQNRDVNYLDEGRAAEDTSDHKPVVSTVDEKLEHYFALTGRAFDALYQQEASNQHANADLIVDGQTLATDVPATFLLGMEKRLKEVRNVMLAQPTLEPNITWSEDLSAGEGRYRSEAVTSFKTEKRVEHQVLVAATDKHPAQVEKWNVDRNVAKVLTTHLSGCITPAEKSRRLERVDLLIEGVKKARQRANCVEAEKGTIADSMFSYIMGG